MEGIQRLGKNKWYERSHWTYKVNRRWLIKRGIEAFHWSNSQGFHWSIFPRAKFLWEIPKNFRVDPEVFPKKKEAAKTRWEKKGAEHYLPYIFVTSYRVISGFGDVIFGHFRWRHFRWRHCSTSNATWMVYIYYLRPSCGMTVNIAPVMCTLSVLFDPSCDIVNTLLALLSFVIISMSVK